MATSPPSEPKIAIIGAGPAGLLLARLLHLSSLPYTLFDADSDPHARYQGGIIDLHAHMGQAALSAAGLLPQFFQASLPGAEAMKLVKFDGSVSWDENTMELPAGLDREKPEIERVRLRDLLIESIPEGSVAWGRKLRSVEPSSEVGGTDGQGEGKYDLVFADGTVERGFDLVVGADGAWSRVRPLLSDTKPFYSGITGVELWAKNVSGHHAWLKSWVGKGTLFMFDEGRMLGCQSGGEDMLRIYPAFKVEEGWLEECGIDWEDHEQVRRELESRFYSDCGEDVKRAIGEGTEGAIPRKLYMLPIGIRWERRAGLTLAGDAAHLMTPFAGVGVNVALMDALELAQALTKRKDGLCGGEEERKVVLEEALKEYEESMFVRAKENMEKTYKGLLHHFDKHGVDERANRMKKALAELQRRAEKAEEGPGSISKDGDSGVKQKQEEIEVVREAVARQKLE